MPSSALCWQKTELVEAMPSLSQSNALVWQLWWTPATPDSGRGTGRVCQDLTLYKPENDSGTTAARSSYNFLQVTDSVSYLTSLGTHYMFFLSEVEYFI